ncbi:hypothetical protein ACIREB_09985 [Streptomyces anulatus]
MGLLLHIATPSAGLAVSAALVWTGSLALTSSPAVRGEAGHKKAAAGPAPSEELDSGVQPAPPGRRPLQGGPGLRQAITVSATVGICPGAFNPLVIAFADEHEDPAAVTWILAALSGGAAPSAA